MELNRIREWAALNREQVIDWRRKLHMCPELGFQEFETSRIIQNALREMGLPFEVMDTGVIAEIEPFEAREGRIALRADIDALPIEEPKEFSFASRNPGVMHACGHDTHTAMLLGTAKLLWEHRDALEHPVRLIFQPAEERSGGALKMIEAGALKDVTSIYCLHVRSSLAVGRFATRSGIIHASSDGFEIRVTGKGAHAASPQNGVDAVVIASHIVLAIQELISREVAPSDQAVLTIGKISGGTAGNVLCGEVSLNGTMRTLNEDVRERLIGRVAELCEGIAKALRGTAEVVYRRGCCTCVNDDACTQHAIDLAHRLFGMDSVEILREPSMGSEDFGYYQRKTPGTKLYIGTGREESIHSASFTVNEDMLEYGVAMLAALGFEGQP